MLEWLTHEADGTRSLILHMHARWIPPQDNKRGRVSAISGLAISASNELGELQSGLAAAVLGATGAVVFGGVGAIFVTALWAIIFPELRRARTFAPPTGSGQEVKEAKP